MTRLGGIATIRISARFLSSSCESKELKICFDVLVAYICAASGSYYSEIGGAQVLCLKFRKIAKNGSEISRASG